MDYDFSDISKKEVEKDYYQYEDEKDPRLNFRISRCCRNCKFFKTHSDYHLVTGLCSVGSEVQKIGKPYKNLHTTIDLESAAKKINWLPTHVTNVCDRHDYKSVSNSINRVESKISKGFGIDGNLDNARTEALFGNEEEAEKGKSLYDFSNIKLDAEE